MSPKQKNDKYGELGVALAELPHISEEQVANG